MRLLRFVSSLFKNIPGSEIQYQSSNVLLFVVNVESLDFCLEGRCFRRYVIGEIGLGFVVSVDEVVDRGRRWHDGGYILCGWSRGQAGVRGWVGDVVGTRAHGRIRW